MAKGMCLHARMRVKADTGFTDHYLSAVLSKVQLICKQREACALSSGHYRRAFVSDDRIIVENACLILQNLPDER